MNKWITNNINKNWIEEKSMNELIQCEVIKEN